MNNPRINPAKLYSPLVKAVFANWKDPEIYLTFDTSMLWDEYCLIRVCVVHLGRAIPIGWKVLKHKSSSVQLDTYKDLLKRVSKLLPANPKVVLLALIESTEFMQAALLEGRKALPLCLPNPPVGCVLVKDRDIIAWGHTQSPGMNHAEAMALSKVFGDLSLVTAYVTLEPCSFQGKTPSCAKAIVTSGIKRVIVAMLDPDPRNAGAGIQILRAGGLEVSVGLLEHEAYSDLAPYLSNH